LIELVAIVLLLIVTVPPFQMPPPSLSEPLLEPVLLEMVLLLMVIVPEKALKMPPPLPKEAELLETVLSLMVTVPPLKMPPPLEEELLEMVLLLMVTVPEEVLEMPPPLEEELLEMALLLMVTVPKLRMPPPPKKPANPLAMMIFWSVNVLLTWRTWTLWPPERVTDCGLPLASKVRFLSIMSVPPPVPDRSIVHGLPLMRNWMVSPGAALLTALCKVVPVGQLVKVKVAAWACGMKLKALQRTMVKRSNSVVARMKSA
jgi:hypothetical protein